MLRKRSELRYDEDIANELKIIAQQFGAQLSEALLDARAANAEVIGLLTPKTEDEALDDVLEALGRKCVDGALPLDVARPNVRLFWWLAASPNHRSRLEGYPIITTEDAEGRLHTVSLQRVRGRAPLAPPAIWSTCASPFADLFPRRKILHDLVADPDFCSDPDVWEELDGEGWVRSSPVFSTRRPLQRFLVEAGLRDRDDETHRSTSDVDMSDIAFLTEDDIGLIDVARKRRARAIQLVAFVVTCVMREDTQAFEKLHVECECGEIHSAFSAAWLIPFHDRKWVPTAGGRATVVSAESLANLLAERQDLVDLLGRDEGTRFLEALEVSPADFQLRAVATEESQRLRLVRSMSELARAADGDLERVEMLSQEAREHPEIFDAIQEAQARRDKVQSNQRLGELVEDLLREELAAHGLRVRRTGVGSDFEVESDLTTGAEEVWLEVAGDRTSFLIEVKSARSARVKMTPTQAKMADRESARFALCVVPLVDELPTREVVREQARFVFEIGRLLKQPLQAYSSVENATDGARRSAGNIEVEIAEGQVRFAVSQQVWLGGLGLDAAVGKITRRE